MTSPLIEQLIDSHGYTLLGPDNQEQFITQTVQSVLFFTEDPSRFQESNDVAVVLPELMKVFGDRLTPAVVDRRIEKELQKRYGFRSWPSLVFLRRGEYLGAISRMCDWEDYITDINAILNSEPGRPPTIGIPVKTEQTSSSCH